MPTRQLLAECLPKAFEPRCTTFQLIPRDFAVTCHRVTHCRSYTRSRIFLTIQFLSFLRLCADRSCTFLLDIFQRLRTIRSSRFILKDNIKSSSYYSIICSRILSELGAGRLYLLINVRSRKERKARLPFF